MDTIDVAKLIEDHRRLRCELAKTRRQLIDAREMHRTLASSLNSIKSETSKEMSGHIDEIYNQCDQIHELKTYICALVEQRDMAKCEAAKLRIELADSQLVFARSIMRHCSAKK